MSSFLGTRRGDNSGVCRRILGCRKVCFMWEQMCFVNESVAGHIIFCSSFTNGIDMPIGFVVLFKGL